MKKLLGLIFIILQLTLNAQEVSVSKEFNLRTDYGYEVLGLIEDNILLFRDRGTDHQIEVLGSDLSYKQTRDLSFEEKKIDIVGLISRDSFFTIYYSFKKKDQLVLRARNYDHQGAMIDSIGIFSGLKSLFKEPFNIKVSENKKHVFLYSRGKDSDLNVLAIDNDSLKLVYEQKIDFSDFKLSEDFIDQTITDKGEVFLLFEKDNKNRNKDKHFAEIVYIHPYDDEIISQEVRFNNTLSADIKLAYDNRNEEVLVAGLYHDKNTFSSKGYYFIKIKSSEIREPVDLVGNEYKESLLRDIYGRDKKNKKEIEHFEIQNIIFRKDGGFVLVIEMVKELSRRSYYNGNNRYDTSSRETGAWKDYFNEEVIIVSLHPSGEEHWSKVLHKKQFSQDDNGIYSSYNLFKSPSRLRVIYNDEIKKSNTVSEYVLDPLGNFERNALLNTDQQKLRLRFKDGIQISNNELLVPSERSYILNLVKIKY